MAQIGDRCPTCGSDDRGIQNLTDSAACRDPWHRALPFIHDEEDAGRDWVAIVLAAMLAAAAAALLLAWRLFW